MEWLDTFGLYGAVLWYEDLLAKVFVYGEGA